MQRFTINIIFEHRTDFLSKSTRIYDEVGICERLLLSSKIEEAIKLLF